MFKVLNNNNLFLIKKKLKYLIEVTLETDGTFSISTKLALLLTQSGLYDNSAVFEFLNDYFSYIEINDEIELNRTFLVSFLFIFPKKELKTKIYVFNPFFNSTVNLALKYNLIDFYLKERSKLLYNINLKNKSFEKSILFNFYWEYILNLRNNIFFLKKKRFSFFFLKKKKYSFKNFIKRMNKKRKRLRRKNICKLKKYKKKLKFIFMIKAKKWLNYYIFFKLIIINSYYFSSDYLYLKLKLNLYSFVSFSVFYKSWFVKKLKRRFRFKKKFTRNKFGELMKIIRREVNEKKKKKK